VGNAGVCKECFNTYHYTEYSTGYMRECKYFNSSCAFPQTKA